MSPQKENVMVLAHLIEFLEKQDSDTPVKMGFNNPHSYRGYYSELAFEPCENTTVGEMLECAKSANGATYHGWKGGEYEMSDWSDVYLAQEGSTGEGIGHVLLKYMVGEYN